MIKGIITLMGTGEIITLVSASVGAIGGIVATILKLVKALKENKILIEENKKKEKLLAFEKQVRFYMKLANNLVVSAEKLNVTGVQKKEHVMIYMENEIVKAGVKVDLALMSECIEDTIAILNNYRENPNSDYNKLKQEVIDKHLAQAEQVFDAKIESAKEEIKIQDARKEELVEIVKEGVGAIENTTNSISSENKEKIKAIIKKAKAS